MRIPLGEGLNPNAIRADRLSMNAPDMSGIGRAVSGLGNAVAGLAERMQADQKKMEAYNANLALERWSTDQTIQYQNDLDTSAPDGSDFLQKRDKGLTDSFAKVRAGIKDPELAAKADMIFERTRGRQTVNGMGDVKKKQYSHVIATTNESVNNIIQAGALDSVEQFNDYYDNVIRPRIASVVDDPLQRQKMEGVFGQQLREEFFRLHPEAIARQTSPVAAGDAYYKRLAQIESGGNPRAYNKSGASGLYQFMPGTARQYGLADPFDPVQSQAAVERFTADNRAVLVKRLGREPTAGELYLAHQQGAGGASRLLANPDAIAADIVGKQAVIQNGGTADMTARDFASKWINKFEGIPGPTVTRGAAPRMPSGGIFTGMDGAEYDRYVTRARTEARTTIAEVSKDELPSLEFNGGYTGRSLTADDFNLAFGEDGPDKFEEYEADRKIAIQKHAYKDMTEEQILADINRRTEDAPQGEGAGGYIQNLGELEAAARQTIGERNVRFAKIQAEKAEKLAAANAAMTKRKNDPAGYVFDTNPGVRMAWREFNPNDPQTADTAIASTIAAQEAIGIPSDEVQPLPKSQAEAVAKIVTDSEKDPEQRFDTLFAMVMQTRNPEHQRAILSHLIEAGVPDAAEVAIDAKLRNDNGAARRIFEAAVLKPEQVPGKGNREAGFNDAVNEALFDETGSLIYGTDYADPRGAQMAQRDAALVGTMATLNMLRGKEQADAIAAAIKDVRGESVTLNEDFDGGGGVLGIAPSDVNGELLKAGMGVAMKTVKKIATDQAQRIMMTNSGVTGSNKAVFDAGINLDLEMTLLDGRFRNHGGGWGFYDPYANAFLAGVDGKPLTWTTDELLTLARFGRSSGGGGF